jgi:integrase
MAIKVTLRQKPITGNRQSLYLDFYPPISISETGKQTRREFLGLYVFDKNKTPLDKQHNKETLQLAEQIRQQRENNLNKPEIYTEAEKYQLKIKELGQQNFIEYFYKLAQKRSDSNHDNWMSAYKYLESFSNGILSFSDLNLKFCNDFKEYLLTTKSNKSKTATLSQNSAVSYFNKFKATLKQAFKDEIIQVDLNGKVESIKQAETHRNFLTIEELNQLAKTECDNPLLKRVALFSALTGLRFSDIQKLVWSEIEYIENNGYFIQFKQQKTKVVEMMPISEQAFDMLGNRTNPNDLIFEGLTYSAYENKHLAKWIGLAGITKDITFHCFRHTYATLQLSNGTDIYTVSKMLGHRDLKTTQIYAKIIDQTKRDTTNKIKLEF